MSVDQKIAYKKEGLIREPLRGIQEVEQLTLCSFLETSMLSQTKHGRKVCPGGSCFHKCILLSLSKGRPSWFSKNLPQGECIVFCCSARRENCKHSFCLSRQESLKSRTHPEENYLSCFCVSYFFLKGCGRNRLTNPLTKWIQCLREVPDCKPQRQK